jgi:hypothetical protein
MKAISASIVVLAGAILFTAGDPDSSIEGKIAFLAGAIVGSVGLFTWATLIARRND